jgi:hypothetical protein
MVRVRAWSVSAFFPEVKPAHQAQQSCTVEASSLARASRIGIEQILKLDALKGRRISVARLTIVAAGKEKSQGDSA